MALDLDSYRREAESFLEEIDREYYRHMAGHKPELEIEPIYDRHRGLFGREAVEGLRGLAPSAGGQAARRCRYLLHFALDGLLGLETREQTIELARLEASLEVEGPDGPIPYRGVPAVQANEADAERRASLEAAQNAIVVERMNPLHREALEREHRLCRELGWESYAAAYAELSGIDLNALALETSAFLEATEGAYPQVTGGVLEERGLPPLGELRRSDLPRFFRAPELDRMYPQERLLDSFTETLAGLGIDLATQDNVILDAEPRPTKSPRAFCSPARVPEEVYLVVAPVGGRDDFAALFHEGGHAEHYANVDPALPFEFGHLGDNSVTESFAFMLEHLVSNPLWLSERLGVETADDAVTHARAVRLYFLRRYAAKLTYELELHGPEPAMESMPSRYSELLGRASGVEWPSATWLADVDGGFYVACYLRAWALEQLWLGALVERFGERWFASTDAGAWLRSLWSQGQRLTGHELVADTAGAALDFRSLAGAFA